jgi:molecular chaperone GrpE
VPHDDPVMDENETNESIQDPASASGLEPETGAPAPQGEQAAEPPSTEKPESELERLTRLTEEYLDGWQRARAEFSNYKKRVERDQGDTYRRAAGDILTRYLPIVDDLERALKDRPTEGETAGWAEGIDLIYRKLRAILEAEGVQTIDALGQPFDPSLHEAISHEDSQEHPTGYVIEVLQQGYRMGDQVLRPALVRVAK